ncbi:MAG: hypothetical protein ACFFB3_19010 [Candidatus Hodarchaeota archaeon]
MGSVFDMGTRSPKRFRDFGDVVTYGAFLFLPVPSTILSIALVMLEVKTLKRLRNRPLSWSSLKMAELLIQRTMM